MRPVGRGPNNPVGRPGVAATPAELGTVTDPGLERLRSLVRLLDTAIRVPGTRFRVGLDPLLGLVPGVGDAIGALVSGYIIMQAARLGAPRALLLRMLANVGAETAVGVVPGIGDLFDAAWKANARNYALLEKHLADPTQTRRSSRRALFGIAAAVALLLIGSIALAIYLGAWLVRESPVF